MAQIAELYLAGSYTAGSGEATIAVRSPVTGEHLADLPVPSAGDVDVAVSAARKAFEDYRQWSVYERAELCHRVADLITANAERLARLTTLEQGKPLSEARDDVHDSAALFADSAEDAKRLYGETIPSTAQEQTHVHLPVAGRSLGGHYALELPVDDHVRVCRARTGHRQRDRGEAARTHAAGLPGARGTTDRGRCPGWARVDPAGGWADG